MKILGKFGNFAEIRLVRACYPGLVGDFCLTGTGWSLGGFCGIILVYSRCYSKLARRDGGPFGRAVFGVFAFFWDYST